MGIWATALGVIVRWQREVHCLISDLGKLAFTRYSFDGGFDIEAMWIVFTRGCASDKLEWQITWHEQYDIV